jgi:hypothetical protein
MFGLRIRGLGLARAEAATPLSTGRPLSPRNIMPTQKDQ